MAYQPQASALGAGAALAAGASWADAVSTSAPSNGTLKTTDDKTRTMNFLKRLLISRPTNDSVQASTNASLRSQTGQPARCLTAAATISHLSCSAKAEHPVRTAFNVTQ